jgi:hypothetical protein
VEEAMMEAVNMCRFSRVLDLVGSIVMKMKMMKTLVVEWKKLVVEVSHVDVGKVWMMEIDDVIQKTEWEGRSTRRPGGMLGVRKRMIEATFLEAEEEETGAVVLKVGVLAKEAELQTGSLTGVKGAAL